MIGNMTKLLILSLAAAALGVPTGGRFLDNGLVHQEIKILSTSSVFSGYGDVNQSMNVKV